MRNEIHRELRHIRIFAHLAYWVFLVARHVAYIGRLGQQHIERFLD